MVVSVNSLTDEELCQILEMERELFPDGLQDSYEKEIQKDRVAVLAYCPEGKVAGYVFSIPHSEAYSRLNEADPQMLEMSNAQYIESVAIRKDLQGRGYFSKLMKTFLKEVEGSVVTMHARICNNCSSGMQKHGAQHKHTVSNWFETGEDFDFLVMEKKKSSNSVDE